MPFTAAQRAAAKAILCPPVDPDAPVARHWFGPDCATFLPPEMTPARKRPCLDTSVAPPVRNVAADGSTVAVSLFGAAGRGRELILDRHTWADVSRRFGRHWAIAMDRGTVVFVVCVGGAEGAFALDRYIAGARLGEIVIHRNRDVLDMRTENLEAVPFSQFVMRNSPYAKLRARGRAGAA